jgi:hypothetical protein
LQFSNDMDAKMFVQSATCDAALLARAVSFRLGVPKFPVALNVDQPDKALGFFLGPRRQSLQAFVGRKGPAPDDLRAVTTLRTFLASSFFTPNFRSCSAPLAAVRDHQDVAILVVICVALIALAPAKQPGSVDLSR